MPHSDLSGTFTLVFLLTLLPSGGTLSNTLVDSSGDPLQIPTIMMYFLGDRQPTWYLTSLPFTEKQRVDEVSNMYGTVRRKASIPWRAWGAIVSSRIVVQANASNAR